VWIVPSHGQVSDLHWIAYRVATDRGTSYAGGIADALSWVAGDCVGPITERDEQPVTEALARAETWAALRVHDELTDDPEPSLRARCVRLVVPYWPVRVTDREWANGVWRTLSWLTGTGEAKPPMTLPVRNPDGTAPTVDKLVKAEIAASPHRSWHIPELRVEARHQATVTAAQSRDLIALIDETCQRAGVDLPRH
jgi:hypothetical protein